MKENQTDESLASHGCDNCESWSSVSIEYYEQYRIPDHYNELCRQCAKQTNTHTAEDMSDEELIAAIVDDSIGYCSPAHAENHVSDFRDGASEVWCERGAAVFGQDLDALIESARAHWLRIERGNPEKAERLLDTVEQWQEVEKQQGPMASMSISSLYPTHAPSGGGGDE